MQESPYIQSYTSSNGVARRPKRVVGIRRICLVYLRTCEQLFGQDTNMLLTDTAARNAKRREKPQKLSDGGGLHLLVNPDGARYWRMAYRYHQRQKSLALGVYPIVSLADARAARDAAKKLLARDIDPSEARKEQK